MTGRTQRRPVEQGDVLVYQLKITLLDVEPAVWRRLHVEGSFTLERLHVAIQKVMGWQGAHLYEFQLRGAMEYRNPKTRNMRSNPVWNITLREVAPADDTSFQSVYDLGDNWTHEVLAERSRRSTRRSTIPPASPASAAVRPRIAAAPQGTRIC